jgi:hypothetical protein
LEEEVHRDWVSIKLSASGRTVSCQHRLVLLPQGISRNVGKVLINGVAGLVGLEVGVHGQLSKLSL